MATALFDFPPTPTSLTLIRADFPQLDSGSSAQTNQEPVEPIAELPEPDLVESDRFRIVNLYAAGGQGQIYVARDEQLRRDVALKELKPKHVDRPLSRARFLREAEIAGGLEHPGVVPVYALGKHIDGRPFYAMRLIKGRTMHEWIRDYHRPLTPISQVERNVRFRQLLQRFISVCETIAYAHSRGVVHRDIKPSNVLIGDFGEAIVVDWGLARRYNEVSGCGFEEDNPSYSNPDSDSRADSTMMGSALGTPAFMSPEQSEGRWDQVGPTSDIYSLGATLYVLLTGHLPLKNLAWSEMSRRIRAGDIPPPRQITPWVSRGLDAICRKAMSVNPAQRYPTAKALAEDIEHWLADEPVAAAPEPFREKARRWVRRHRMFVATMGAILVVTSIALGVGLFFVDKERSQTELARQDTQKALERVQEQKNQTEKARQQTQSALEVANKERKERGEALDELTSSVIDQWLGEQQELRPEHRAFLNRALANQRQFAEEKPNDPMGFLGVARAYRRVGEIQLKLGKFKESVEALQDSQQRIAKVDLPGDNASLLQEKARLYSALGKWNRTSGKLVAAEQEFAAARQIWEKLSVAESNIPDLNDFLTTSLNNHAVVLADLKRMNEAAATFSRVLELRKEMATAAPKSRVAERALGKAHVNLGKCFLQMSNCGGAETEFRCGLEIGKRLISDGYTEAEDSELWAASTGKLGRVLLNQQKDDEADKWLTIATATYEQLVALYPSKTEFAEELAGARCNLGTIDHRRKRYDDAIRDYDLALAATARVLRNGSPNPRLQLIVKGIHESKVASRVYRALENAKNGHRDVAVAEINELVADPDCSVTTLYNSACVLSEAGSLDQSIALLKRLEKAGYFSKNAAHVKQLDIDTDLVRLREHEDYKAFRATLPSVPPTPAKK